METVVIGGGHAGLAVSQQLGAHGVEHVVLERERIGGSWRSLRWDSFALNTPSWMNPLPGEMPTDLAQPLDGFLTHEQFADRLERYAREWDLPVHEGAGVERVEVRDGGFRVHLERDAGAPIDARTVVVASGIQNVPRLPPIAAAMPGWLTQLPAIHYRSPDGLEAGAVLVVGAGQTGGQLVDELLEAGREVYWSVSKVTRVPRRYRGRDILEWLVDAGFYEMPPEAVADPAELVAAMPIISGVGRYGHTLSLQWLAGRGARLVGRITSVTGDTVELDDSVAACVRFGDQRSQEVCAQVDRLIGASGRPLPAREPDEADVPFDAFEALDPPARLDLRDVGVNTVIWATGVTGDFAYLPAGATDAAGLPAHEQGSAAVDGLEYIGLPWLTRRGSGIINGISKDAALVAERVAARLEA